MDEKPTMIERLEEYERPLREHADKIAERYRPAYEGIIRVLAAENAEDPSLADGSAWHDIGWVEKDEAFVWGDPKPVREDYYLAWRDRDVSHRLMVTATFDEFSYEMLALVYGKPQKKDYKRARDFRAARRRHARWKKGRP